MAIQDLSHTRPKGAYTVARVTFYNGSKEIKNFRHADYEGEKGAITAAKAFVASFLDARGMKGWRIENQFGKKIQMGW
jgi:hypothetical protein